MKPKRAAYAKSCSVISIGNIATTCILSVVFSLQKGHPTVRPNSNTILDWVIGFSRACHHWRDALPYPVAQKKSRFNGEPGTAPKGEVEDMRI